MSTPSEDQLTKVQGRGACYGTDITWHVTDGVLHVTTQEPNEGPEYYHYRLVPVRQQWVEVEESSE
jgi:hypothetical protein